MYAQRRTTPNAKRSFSIPLTYTTQQKNAVHVKWHSLSLAVFLSPSLLLYLRANQHYRYTGDRTSTTTSPSISASHSHTFIPQLCSPSFVPKSSSSAAPSSSSSSSSSCFSSHSLRFHLCLRLQRHTMRIHYLKHHHHHRHHHGNLCQCENTRALARALPSMNCVCIDFALDERTIRGYTMDADHKFASTVVLSPANPSARRPRTRN